MSLKMKMIWKKNKPGRFGQGQLQNGTVWRRHGWLSWHNCMVDVFYNCGTSMKLSRPSCWTKGHLTICRLPKRRTTLSMKPRDIEHRWLIADTAIRHHQPMIPSLRFMKEFYRVSIYKKATLDTLEQYSTTVAHWRIFSGIIVLFVSPSVFQLFTKQTRKKNFSLSLLLPFLFLFTKPQVFLF